jgi:Allene oxide cyclase barrel like domain
MDTARGISIENIKEVCRIEIRTGGPDASGVNLGASVTFHDELYDEDGNKLGIGEGTAVVFGASDGTLMQIVSAIDEFLDGTVVYTGTYPMFPMDEAKVVSAIGTHGRYLGKRGTRSFRLLNRQDAETSIIKGSLFLD